MKIIEPSNTYGAHWGLTDLYEQDAANLKAALAADEDFEFDYGCKKEIHYAKITRRNGILFVECRAYIDDLPELLDTAFWQAFGGNDFAPSGGCAVAKAHDRSQDDDDFIQSVFDVMANEIEEAEIYSEIHRASKVVLDQSFDSVMKAVDELEDEASAAGQACYENIIEYIKISWEASQEKQDMKL